MNRKISIALATLALGALALTGCAQTGGGGAPGYGGGAPSSAQPSTSAPSTSTAPAASGETELQTADSSLGTIIVDGAGKSIYVFDSDTPGNGKSVCEGVCLAMWPPVVAGAEATKVDGITGEIGSITRSDGTMQVTLNGSPLYYFKGDAAKGDVNGQGFGGIWWVVGADGKKITS